jgi:hypothetical protein
MKLDLDRLEELERKATEGPWDGPCADVHARIPQVFSGYVIAIHRAMSDADYDLAAALRNSAPSLIRLAREGLAARKATGTPDPEVWQKYRDIRTANEEAERERA